MFRYTYIYYTYNKVKKCSLQNKLYDYVYAYHVIASYISRETVLVDS